MVYYTHAVILLTKGLFWLGRHILDLTGLRFGRLVVKKFHHRDRDTWWECICDCGRTTIVRTNHLRSGNTSSCGCYLVDSHIVHGDANTRLYHIWINMKARCCNPNHPRYKDYGGRGITICSEWREDFQNFKDWALNKGGYSDHKSIDRIDNNKRECGYSPENCRFTNDVVQANNKNNNYRLTMDGRTQTLSEWAREYGIHPKTLQSRIVRSGWSIKDALTRDVVKEDKPIKFNGESHTVKEWADLLGISDITLRYRLVHWTVEKALTTPLCTACSRDTAKRYEYNGEILPLKALCAKYGKPYRSVLARLKEGWKIEDAIELPPRSKKPERK